MVPRSELALMGSRLLSLEESSKKKIDQLQTAVDALQQRLRTCIQENESLQAIMQASSQQ